MFSFQTSSSSFDMNVSKSEAETVLRPEQRTLWTRLRSETAALMSPSPSPLSPRALHSAMISMISDMRITGTKAPCVVSLSKSDPCVLVYLTYLQEA